MNRRRFLRAGAVLGGVGVLALAGVELTGAADDASGGARRRVSRSPSTAATQPVAPATSTQVAAPYSQAMVEENARIGTTDFNIGNLGAPWSIEGYFDRASAAFGDSVRLFVSTTAPSFQVQAYRMGWYQGLGGRLVWQSATLPGRLQAPGKVTSATNMVDAPWEPSTAIVIDEAFVPGCYLFKLIASTGEGRFVPLTVRDDASNSAIVVVNAVTTWQAYNGWGNYSLYNGPSGFASRSRVVSFDRPYETNGAPEFLGVELPVVRLVERLGLDVSYLTSLDIHRAPELLARHRAMVSLGHDEYWSKQMRDGTEHARDAGVNLLFLGANAAYRQIRLETSPLGELRRQVCYKSAGEDPITGLYPTLATGNWRDTPVNRPEAQLLGEQYECNPVSADLVVARPDSWVFTGTGLTQGARLPGIVGGEYDRYVAGPGIPANIEILAHSPLNCRGRSSYADMTYYNAPSGAGVIDTGTQTWNTHLDGTTPNQTIVDITTNILLAFGKGPAATTYPAQP
jgi:hypothetical protein